MSSDCRILVGKYSPNIDGSEVTEYRESGDSSTFYRSGGSESCFAGRSRHCNVGGNGK